MRLHREDPSELAPSGAHDSRGCLTMVHPSPARMMGRPRWPPRPSSVDRWCNGGGEAVSEAWGSGADESEMRRGGENTIGYIDGLMELIDGV